MPAVQFVTVGIKKCGTVGELSQPRLISSPKFAILKESKKGNRMTFYKLFILSTNSIDEFCVDSEIYRSADFAMKKGMEIYNCNDNVTGYIVVQVKDDSWKVIYQSVEEQVDFTVYENNGRIWVKEGMDQIVMV